MQSDQRPATKLISRLADGWVDMLILTARTARARNQSAWAPPCIPDGRLSRTHAFSLGLCSRSPWLCAHF